MSLQELKEQAVKLSVGDRLALVDAILESLPTSSRPIHERVRAVEQMRGLLKTAQPAPTDEEIATMLEERRIEKYSP